jgi:hypothetical protein
VINQEISPEAQEIESRPKLTLELYKLTPDKLFAKLENNQIVEIYQNHSPAQLYNGKFPSNTVEAYPIEISHEQKELIDNIFKKISEHLIRIKIWQGYHTENSQHQRQELESKIICFQLFNSLFFQNQEDVCEFTLEEISKIDLNKLVLVFNYARSSRSPSGVGSFGVLVRSFLVFRLGLAGHAIVLVIVRGIGCLSCRRH